MADEPFDVAEVLKQEFANPEKWNYDAIDAIVKAMQPVRDYSALFAEFARVQGMYPSLEYAMWHGNEVERGEMPTWVEFMKLYGDVLIPMTGNRSDMMGNMHELVERHKSLTHTKPARTAVRASCAVCKAPAYSACGACATVRYCGKACQRSDWKVHEKTCARS